MPTAILAEDEPILRAQLQAKLAKLWPELDIIASVEDGAAALEALEDRTPDFMFLDIQMPEMTGLEVARHVGSRSHVVFVTAYDQYAIQAFEAGAVDYVLKPVTDERLALTVERLKSKAATPPPDLTALLARIAGQVSPKRERLQWIKATVGQQLRLIPVADVLFFQSDEKYTRVVTCDGEALIRKPIRELLEELDPDRFWQVHRATIVNVDFIAGVRRGLRDQAELSLKDHAETLVVSRAFTHLFKQM